ncbi:MAG: hypothetical protein WC967_14730 [Balneolaceae bacterium]
MKILIRVFTFLSIVFNKLRGFNEEYVFPFIDLLELIRDAVKSDSVKWLVELTKFDWDDKMRNKIIEKLSKTIIKLQLGSDCLDKKTPEEVIECFIEHLKQLQPVTRDALLQKLASVSVKDSMLKGRIKQHEADLAVQLAYSVRKQNREKELQKEAKNA